MKSEISWLQQSATKGLLAALN